MYYFNRNIEVDFYVPDEGLAVQASYRMSDESTLEREIKALVALNSLYPLKKALIVTYEDEGMMGRDGLKIEIVPVWKWVLVSDVESAVKRLYRNSDVVLSADDYAGIEIVVELPPISSANYLGLEIEEGFLAMSKARRVELEDITIRNNYFNQLISETYSPTRESYFCRRRIGNGLWCSLVRLICLQY